MPIIFGSKRQTPMYAYVRVSIDSSLYKPTLTIPMMTTLYAYIWIAKDAHLYKPILWFLIMPISKCPYLCLKTCPLSTSISGPVNILVYSQQHQGFQNYFLYTPIFGSQKTPLCVWTCEGL